MNNDNDELTCAWFNECDQLIIEAKKLADQMRTARIDSTDLDIAIDNIAEAYGIAHAYSIEASQLRKEDYSQEKVHVKGCNVYLSGPMTGIEDFNRKEFNDAAKYVKRLGASCIYNPAENISYLVNKSHEYCMYCSLNALIKRLVCICGTKVTDDGAFYDVLVSLPCWQDSAGARLEREVAEACGIEVCELSEVIE